MDRFENFRRKTASYVSGLNRRRRKAIPDVAFMFVLAVVIGLISGALAWVLKHSIAGVSHLVAAHLKSFQSNWLLFVAPLAALVLTGLLTRHILKARLAHGVRMLIEQLRKKNYFIGPKRILWPLIASTVTLGLGGSAGSEGPIACSGAAVGGNIGRWCGMSPEGIRLLIGCGAGAGIAGIFKAPLGGALFTLEVMRMPMSTIPVLALLVCTITAAMTAYALGGFSLDLEMADAVVQIPPSLYPFLIGLGIVCGAYSIYYSFIMKFIGMVLERMRRPFVRNIVGGAMLGAGVFFLPALYGEGYGVITHLLNGRFSALVADGPFAGASDGPGLLLFVALLTVAYKCFATASTNSGGGVSGNFAPTLMAGCVVGFLYAYAANTWFGTNLPVGLFALMGMGGVMAGVIRAPLMALLLTTEMVGAYANFLPMLIVTACSFGVVRLFTFDGFYSGHFDRPNGLMSKLHG